MRAATRLCICDTCQKEYGSCSLFQEYGLVVGQLENTQLRLSNIDYAGVEDELVQESEGMNSLDDLLVPDNYWRTD